MSNTSKRIIAGIVMAVIFCLIALLQYWGLPAVRWTAVIISIGMITEMILAIVRAPNDLLTNRNRIVFFGFLAWLVVVLIAAYAVGEYPLPMLSLLMIICGADIGGWLFGNLFGDDKMWERISPKKTWAGQIGGIACGTLAAILYEKLTGEQNFLWVGMGVALLSQYGDLTSSWIKRRLKLKDFGNIIPGHGGFIDRFDGWIYALPLVWLILL